MQQRHVEASVRRTLENALRVQGASGFRIDISFHDHFVRSNETMGKLKMTGAPT